MSEYIQTQSKCSKIGNANVLRLKNPSSLNYLWHLKNKDDFIIYQKLMNFIEYSVFGVDVNLIFLWNNFRIEIQFPNYFDLFWNFSKTACPTATSSTAIPVLIRREK